MLPAPINLIPSFFIGVHMWWLWNVQRQEIYLESQGKSSSSISSGYQEEGIYYDGWKTTDEDEFVPFPVDNSRNSTLNSVDTSMRPKTTATRDPARTISICGTIADKTIGILMAFVGPVFELAKIVRLIFRRSFSFRRYLRQFTSLTLLFILSYLPYVFFLIWEVLEDVTEVCAVFYIPYHRMHIKHCFFMC